MDYILSLFSSFSSKPLTISKMNSPLKQLPSDVQQLIYEFAGPDPAAEEAYTDFLDLIQTGRIGIPAWITCIEKGISSDTCWIERRFVIPSYSYYELRKIKKMNWWFPTDRSNYFFNKYNQQSPYHFAFSYKLPKFQKLLREDNAIIPGSEYCIFNEGGFTTPYIPLSFREADDYELLYTLKVTRGNSKEEVIKYVESWYKFRKEVERQCGESPNYLDGIYNKLKTLITEFSYPAPLQSSA